MGIGFAIPVSIARTVLEQIVRDGEVTRGWLGVEPQDLTDEVARTMAVNDARGVLIRSMVRDGPADRAGMRVRDVVVEIDGTPIRDTASLLARIAALVPGSPAHVKVVRDRKLMDLHITAGRRPKPET